ncbi:MAG: ACT domain-containing protein [Tindallia sp. MSAO_Bac2]|nr:MAG: ACT domain-containing protein [Tindallia sp. MSAO_Bac2]
MDQQKVIISVLGRDRVGIIATISNILADHNANIVDISQTILQDYFTMIMLVDVTHSPLEFNELKKRIAEAGDAIGMQVNVQNTEIFDYMHRI